MTLKRRLHRLEKVQTLSGHDQPSLEICLREAALVRRWLAQIGYASPQVALAAGLQTPAACRYVTLELMEGGMERARLWRQQRTHAGVRPTCFNGESAW